MGLEVVRGGYLRTLVGLWQITHGVCLLSWRNVVGVHTRLLDSESTSSLEERRDRFWIEPLGDK